MTPFITIRVNRLPKSVNVLGQVIASRSSSVSHSPVVGRDVVDVARF